MSRNSAFDGRETQGSGLAALAPLLHTSAHLGQLLCPCSPGCCISPAPQQSLWGGRIRLGHSLGALIPCGGQKSLMAVTFLFIKVAEALSFHNMLKSMIALRSLKNEILG